MGIRKNVKFLSALEKENYVKACILMKADIVNPAAPAASQYSKWDEFVGIHWMIQDAFAPGSMHVNFGHGGLGSYSFLSWHRYFLYQVEQKLQSYVPGVMIPYWDWTDPGSIMTDTFIGPNGDIANNNVIGRGYFAFNKPGSGGNPTALPVWWPASLNGWRLPSMFPSNLSGGLRRQTGDVSALPPIDDLRKTLNKSAYRDFQNVLEGGDTTNPDLAQRTSTEMHGAIHGWVGGHGTGGTPFCSTRINIGHMTCNTVSAFDPLFYLHHSNVDRLWAMWQMDGHQNEYPTSGGNAHHNRADLMFPWIGGAAGYGTNISIVSSIPIPSGLPAKINGDTLDFRNAFGYTYDTIPIIGIGLDRTGSMNGMTPDPMTTVAPDVTKWEAAKRGVSAFLQDCETFQNSKTMYVMAGIKTFRTLAANDFSPVFGSPNSGLIKTGTSFSRATFDANVAVMTPGGSTPLADALTDVQNTLVEAPFSGVPTVEQRYLAMLTDGILTSGSPMSSIPNHSMGRTAIFAMGFGTGMDVDYSTLASMVAKGRTLSTQQVFHGENAGTIDKFYSNALAAAIGFTSILDPVFELFEGEYTHLSFTATSADDAFYLTAQGMDFNDNNWSFILHGPGGQMLYGEEEGHMSHGANMCDHCCQIPDVTSTRSNGRLTIVIQRGNADKECWVGDWMLMFSYKAKGFYRMLMTELGETLFPVSAWPIKGDRYARLLTRPGLRTPTRNIAGVSLHGLDVRAVSTNSNDKEACSIVVNVYARTKLKTTLSLSNLITKQGEELKIMIDNNILTGSVRNTLGFARLISPAFDIYDIIPKEIVIELIKLNEQQRRSSSKTNFNELIQRHDKEKIMEFIKFNERQNRTFNKLDFALLLARYEKEKKGIVFIKDNEVEVVTHENSPLHIHLKDTLVKGTYHLGVIVEGLYYPDEEQQMDDNQGNHTMNNMHEVQDSHEHSMTNSAFEVFTRVLNISFLVE